MQTISSVDQTLVRELNLSTVLRYLYANAPLSRAQLATITGLNKSTVSSIVEDLIERRLVHETGLNVSGTGRPATLLQPDPQAGCIIGVELGVDFVSVVMADFTGKFLWRDQEDADPSNSQEVTLAQALRLADRAVARAKAEQARLLGLGLSTPGTVNLDEGLLVFAPNLHWYDVPFRKIFSDRTGLPVMVDNDANAAAMGEHLFGAARQAQDFIFVFAGVGIGGGLFLGGKLYRGKNGFAGEIGHSLFMAEPYQTPCHCGNRGCWETYANQYSIVERVRASLEVRRSSLLPVWMVERNVPLSFSLILQAARAGDTVALDALAEAGSAMGVGVVNLVNIFNPEIVILGGPLSAAGDYLLAPINKAIQERCLPEFRSQTQVILSAFGRDASLEGAVALVVEAILSAPTTVDRVRSLEKNGKKELIER